MAVAIVGCGMTGTRIARQLHRASDPPQLVLVDRRHDVARSTARSLGGEIAWGGDVRATDGCDVVVLAVASGEHGGLAERVIAEGRTCVSVSDSVEDTETLLGLDRLARARSSTVIVGAGMMPGLTDVLVAHGAAWFDRLDEVHVSKFGTGGPDCARQHHRALKSTCLDWRGQWTRRAGGSGRELAWFPQPVQAADCYRARLPDPILIVRSHPSVNRVTARMAATRRDRLTMHLPMLRRPHPEGLLGAVRVELRGLRDGRQAEVILGCAERPAVAAGAVAAATVRDLMTRRETEAGGMGISPDHRSCALPP